MEVNRKPGNPVTFQYWETRAAVEGRKSVMRNVIRLNDAGRIARGGRSWHPEDPEAWRGCLFRGPGDVLWVREAWAVPHAFDGHKPREIHPRTRLYWREAEITKSGLMWRLAPHMPRWASRIDLSIRRVTVERLRGITDEEALREGIRSNPAFWDGGADGFSGRPRMWGRPCLAWLARFALYKRRSGYGVPWRDDQVFDLNPWVWRTEFDTQLVDYMKGNDDE